ncbi:MAG: radical SAM protein [Bacteroidetes bacterium]|nr:MAG: radical SAM protein [Bacteroidota bacterium]
MNNLTDFEPDDRWILAQRTAKNPVDVRQPYAWLAEPERTAAGTVEQVATVFLTNKECPFRCLMCDLWKNTTDEKTPAGAIPHQIEYALKRLPPTRHIKLYNSGNFFDTGAIPPDDYPAIAALLDPFETVIVEAHPKLINARCLQFRDMLKGRLEVAIGLETAHPGVLQRLNKRMDLNDFRESVRFLTGHGIQSRAFTLLRPPFLTEPEGVYWAKRTLDVAFEAGVGCCVVIPTRAGNGGMDWLQAQGYFSPPALESLEAVMAYGLRLGAGRVFADLWDLHLFSDCPDCFEQRKARLETMNLHQTVPPEITCVSNHRG